MASTKRIDYKVRYQRTGKIFPRMKKISASKKVSETKVKNPTTNSILEGIKSDVVKGEVLKTREKAKNFRLLGTETAANVAQAVGALANNKSSVTVNNPATSGLQQNIDGGARPVGNTRDDDDNPEVI